MIPRIVDLISSSPLDVIFGILGSIFLLIAAIVPAAFHYKKQWSRIFLYISFAEFFLWIFVTCLLMANIASRDVPLEVVVLLHRFGTLSSRVGLLVWFIVFQLLGSSEQKPSRHVLFGLIIIFLGFSAGYNISTVQIQAVGNNWVLVYDPLGIVLLIITYASFAVFQMVVYYQYFLTNRKRHYGSYDLDNLESTMLEYVIVHGYFLVYSLAIISFVLAQVEIIPIPSTSWILFGGMSQFLLSLAVVRYPRALILGNLTFHEIGIYSSRDGLTLFHISPQESSETDFLTVALRGMETVISRLIGAQKPMTALGFGDRSIILYKINSQYLYAIVNDPSYIARDLIRALSSKWKRILKTTSKEKTINLVHDLKVQSFMRELRQFLS